MRSLDEALELIRQLLLAVLAFGVSAFVIVEDWVRSVLLGAGLPRGLVNATLVVLAVALLVAVVRMLGGLFRALLLVLLALLLIHVLVTTAAPL